jgi:hypothetical protein
MGKDDTKPAGKYTFCYAKGIENCELGTGFYVHKLIISAVSSYIALKGRCRCSERSCPNRG